MKGYCFNMTKVKKILEKLTPRERKFVIEFVKNLDSAEAARLSFNLGGKSDNATQKQKDITARTLGFNVKNRKRVTKAIDMLMDEFGLSDVDRIVRLAELVHGSDSNVSVKALDQSWKLTGSYAPEKKMLLGKLPFMDEIITSKEDEDEESMKEE